MAAIALSEVPTCMANLRCCTIRECRVTCIHREETIRQQNRRLHLSRRHSRQWVQHQETRCVRRLAACREMVAVINTQYLLQHSRTQRMAPCCNHRGICLERRSHASAWHLQSGMMLGASVCARALRRNPARFLQQTAGMQEQLFDLRSDAVWLSPTTPSRRLWTLSRTRARRIPMLGQHRRRASSTRPPCTQQGRRRAQSMTTRVIRSFRPLRRPRRSHQQELQESVLLHTPMANLVSRSLRLPSLQSSLAVPLAVRSTDPFLAQPSPSPSRVTGTTTSTTTIWKLSLRRQPSLVRRASERALGPLCQERMGRRPLRQVRPASHRWPNCSRLNPVSGIAPSA